MLGIYLVFLFGGLLLLAWYLSHDKRVKHSTHPAFEIQQMEQEALEKRIRYLQDYMAATSRKAPTE